MIETILARLNEKLVLSSSSQRYQKLHLRKENLVTAQMKRITTRKPVLLRSRENRMAGTPFEDILRPKKENDSWK
jgi:hypothetical protein